MIGKCLYWHILRTEPVIVMIKVQGLQYGSNNSIDNWTWINRISKYFVHKFEKPKNHDSFVVHSFILSKAHILPLTNLTMVWNLFELNITEINVSINIVILLYSILIYPVIKWCLKKSNTKLIGIGEALVVLWNDEIGYTK